MRSICSAVRIAFVSRPALRLPICRSAQETAFFTYLRSSVDRSRISGSNEANVPSGSALVKELKTAPLDDTDIHWLERTTLTRDGWTLDHYVDDGYRYFVTNPGISGTYTTQPRRYPTQALFYRELRRDGCLLHVFRPDAHRDGPVIRVYEVSDFDSASAAARSPDCTAPSMYPAHTVAVSAPAQWMRPIGARSARPYPVHTPGGKNAP